jgi:hypothetical protein
VPIHPIRTLAALALIVGIAGSVAAGHYHAVTPTLASQNAKTEDQIDPKASLRTEGARPLDETAITPMETVGAPAQL